MIINQWIVALRSNRLLQSRIILGVGGITLMLMTVYYLYTKLKSDPYLNYIVTIDHESGRQPKDQDLKADMAQPLSYYETKIQGRDLFAPSRPGTFPASLEPGFFPEAVAGIGQFILKGIMIDDKPQAILQDNTTQKTYFVHAGESIEGTVVLDIKPDHVSIQSAGQVMELKLK